MSKEKEVIITPQAHKILTGRVQKSQFYSLPFAQAVASMY